MPEIPSSPPLLESLGWKDYGITTEEIMNGRLMRMVNNGLQVVTLCNHGSGRSYNVARDLSVQGVPSVCVRGGFDGLVEHPDPLSLSPIYYELNQVPNLAIILTREEQIYYLHQINQLRAFRYNSSESAIQSLLTMIPNE